MFGTEELDLAAEIGGDVGGEAGIGGQTGDFHGFGAIWIERADECAIGIVVEPRGEAVDICGGKEQGALGINLFSVVTVLPSREVTVEFFSIIVTRARWRSSGTGMNGSGNVKERASDHSACGYRPMR